MEDVKLVDIVLIWSPSFLSIEKVGSVTALQTLILVSSDIPHSRED